MMMVNSKKFWWLGLLLAAVFLMGAIRLRRYRDDT